MTPSQEKYLKQRLNEIFNNKVKNLNFELTEVEKDSLVAQGKFKVQKDRYGHWVVFFEQEAEVRKRYDTIRQKLTDEKNKLLDQAVFGDDASVAAAFADFSAIDVTKL